MIMGVTTLKMKIPTSTKEPFEKIHIKEGMYPAKFVEAKEIKEGKFGKRIALLFILQGVKNERGEEIQLPLVVSDKPATKNNKLGECLEAFGEVIDGSDKDLDDFKGKLVNVLVEDYETTTKNFKTGKEENVVASIITKVKAI
jgi:hypothetical protein